MSTPCCGRSGQSAVVEKRATHRCTDDRPVKNRGGVAMPRYRVARRSRGENRCRPAPARSPGERSEARFFWPWLNNFGRDCVRGAPARAATLIFFPGTRVGVGSRAWSGGPIAAQVTHKSARVCACARGGAPLCFLARGKTVSPRARKCLRRPVDRLSGAPASRVLPGCGHATASRGARAITA